MSITEAPIETPETPETVETVDPRPEWAKEYDAICLDAVKRGIALLEEEHGPDWVDKLNLESLNLRNGSSCVLGQVYGDYEEGCLALEDKRSGFDPSDYGFMTPNPNLVPRYGEDGEANLWDALQSTWEDALTPRVSSV